MAQAGTTLKELLTTKGSNELYLSPGLTVGVSPKFKPFLETIRPRGNSYGFAQTAAFDLPRKQLLNGVSLYFKVTVAGGAAASVLPNGAGAFIENVRFVHGSFKMVIPGDWLTVNALIDNSVASAQAFASSYGFGKDAALEILDASREYVLKIPSQLWDNSYFPLLALADMPTVEIDFRSAGVIGTVADAIATLTDCALVCQFVNIPSEEAEAMLKSANESGGIRIPFTEIISKRSRQLKTDDAGNAVEISLANVSGLVHAILMTVRNAIHLGTHNHNSFAGNGNALKIDSFEIMHNNRTLDISNKPISGFVSSCYHIPTQYRGATTGNSALGFEDGNVYGIVLSKSGKDSLHNAVLGYTDFFNSSSSYCSLTVTGCTNTAPAVVDFHVLRHNVLVINSYQMSTLKVSSF